MFVDWMLAVVRFAAVASICPRIVSRDDWGARLPKRVTEMHNPVNTVVIHHTYEPAYCNSSEACIAAMQSMQNFHMDDRKWDDIGYSFAVGGDGRVYKGRGWNRVGAHAPPYNFDSIGITLIGDWRDKAPTEKMLDATKWLIQCGVQTGRISASYQLIGHRQARTTDCPGNALYAVIQKWDRWTETPIIPHAKELYHTEMAVEHQASDGASDVPTSVAAAGSYNPANPNAERDAVEVRQLNKRSMWDRLVHIWQQEAIRQSRQEQARETTGNS